MAPSSSFLREFSKTFESQNKYIEIRKINWGNENSGQFVTKNEKQAPKV